MTDLARLVFKINVQTQNLYFVYRKDDVRLVYLIYLEIYQKKMLTKYIVTQTSQIMMIVVFTVK